MGIAAACGVTFSWCCLSMTQTPQEEPIAEFQNQDLTFLEYRYGWPFSYMTISPIYLTGPTGKSTRLTVESFRWIALAGNVALAMSISIAVTYLVHHLTTLVLLAEMGLFGPSFLLVQSVGNRPYDLAAVLLAIGLSAAAIAICVVCRR